MYSLRFLVIDGGIIARIDHADDIEAAGGRALHGMALLAGQEHDVAPAHAGLGVLGPHHAVAVQEYQRLLIEMAVRLRLGERNVADELGDDRRAVLTGDQQLIVTLGHLLTLRRIDGCAAVRVSGIELGLHAFRPDEILASGTVRDEYLEPLERLDAVGFAWPHIDAGEGLDREAP